jgi:hypothetical protein
MRLCVNILTTIDWFESKTNAIFRIIVKSAPKTLCYQKTGSLENRPVPRLNRIWPCGPRRSIFQRTCLSIRYRIFRALFLRSWGCGCGCGWRRYPHPHAHPCSKSTKYPLATNNNETVFMLLLPFAAFLYTKLMTAWGGDVHMGELRRKKWLPVFFVLHFGITWRVFSCNSPVYFPREWR